MRLKTLNSGGWYWQQTGLVVGIGRAVNDEQKAVIPTVIYTNTMHPALKPNQMPGFFIHIGIWDIYAWIGWVNPGKK